jgi:asparagine synthase (glutamine-hydrolysing)
MCGIAGLWWAGGQRQETAEAVAAAMAARLHHRGPDARGVWADGAAGIALGHARLSILDLSPAGAQPMASASGRHVIVFNGEIYNHLELRRELEAAGAAPAWRGHSDTETLLAAFEHWGVEPALERANGMFALGLWDRRARSLTLARDRMGEKPLYWGRAGGALVFASELKALRAVPGFEAEIEPASLAAYLRLSYVPEPHAIYRGVQKVEPGATLRLTGAGDGEAARHYWSLAETIAEARPLDGTPTALADRVEACLAEVVASQMLSDVPLGCFLSGGIDSSLTAALMTKAARGPVRTYAIGFEDARFNEAPHARRVAAHLGTEHTEFTVTEAEALGLVDDLPQIYDEPFADPSQIPTVLLSRLTRQHVTVALSGDGGDEVFGGYNRYVLGPRLLGWGRRLPGPMRRVAGRSVAALQRMGTSERSWLRPAARSLGLPVTTVDKLSRFGRAFADAGDVEALYRGLVSTNDAAASLMAAPAAEAASWSLGPVGRPLAPAEWMMAADTLTYLPGDILVKVDRAAMSASLETRAPFLDRRVVELAWRLLLPARVDGGTGKRILRDILHRHVPREIMERPKQGFAVPLDRWLRGPLKSWAGDLLAPVALRTAGLLDADAVGRLWAAHQSGRDNAGQALWSVLMLQGWVAAGASVAVDPACRARATA